MNILVVDDEKEITDLIQKSRMIMSYGVKSMIIKCAIKIDQRGLSK